MAGFLGRLVVNLVLLLITFIAYSSQIFIIWPWYGRVVSIELLTLLLPFNILVAMLLWNYFLTVVTDPGQVPENWKPDTHEDGYEVKKLTGGPRYCRMCERPKPPRTHHCRQCGRCVLRMDHHCPWVNNCVGHFNHGHFIRFLFYVDLACSYHLAMVTRRVFYSMGKRYWDEPDNVELVFIILNFVACVPVLLSVGAFSLYHFSGLMGNTTTIEGWEKDKVATMVRRGKIREVGLYFSIGRRRNIESILGENPWLWCWPITTPGNGLKFKLTEGDDSDPPEVWPPQDPAAMHYGDPDKEFVLPDSPWTYENGSVNPALQPSNSAVPRRRSRNTNGASALPPYHPDYQAGADIPNDHNSTDEEGDYHRYTDGGKTRVRRGSEGYEIRPVGREDMLARYLRYHRYIPQEGSDSDSEDIPLGQQLH
ncbi:DHHC palmitoyltransferase-domain-containing protein [Mycena sp. CBHHK59/15]|nr:DHHC palmitoyltransferase-domain-containing protein [Mycena sp. CBHHK59/15]